MPFVELKKTVPVLYAFNLDEARLFYTNQLGFLCRQVYSSILSIERGGVEIHIRRVQEAVAPVSCHIHVAGIEDLFEEYFLKEIVDSSEFISKSQLGNREFKVFDLYGNVLIFFETGVLRQIGEVKKDYCFTERMPRVTSLRERF